MAAWEVFFQEKEVAKLAKKDLVDMLVSVSLGAVRACHLMHRFVRRHRKEQGDELRPVDEHSQPVLALSWLSSIHPTAAPRPATPPPTVQLSLIKRFESDGGLVLPDSVLEEDGLFVSDGVPKSRKQVMRLTRAKLEEILVSIVYAFRQSYRRRRSSCGLATRIAVGVGHIHHIH